MTDLTTKPLSVLFGRLANLYSRLMEIKTFGSATNFHADVLLAMYNQPSPISQLKLAYMLQIEKSHMSAIIYYLHSEGFLEMAPIVIDRKDHLVSLTPKGRSIVERMCNAVEEINQQIQNGVSISEWNNFHDTLNKLEYTLREELNE